MALHMSPAPAVRPDERIVHPLEQLRGRIRRYVVIESLLTIAIFLGIWYAALLALDYGVFKLFTWDWVMEAGRWLRGAALTAAVVVLAVLLVRRLVVRLTTELSYPALALVLERRYPELLGDRLITAVELADVEGAARYGYSPAMIRATIAEARELVGKVDVAAVFNWRRLWRMALLAVALPVGIITAAMIIHAVAVGGLQPRLAAWKLWHVSAIAVERNVLLWDTPWPRRALLVPDAATARGLRIARDGGVARLRTEAFRWVIADRSCPDGWRPLLWSDVTPELIGQPIPAVPLALLGRSDEPSTRDALLAVAGARVAPISDPFPDVHPLLPADPAAWTVDALEERLQHPEVAARLRAAMGSDYDALLAVWERLEAIVADPAWFRRLRKLDRPSQVTFTYRGRRTAGNGPLSPEGEHSYVGEITGLKENVQFVLRAEDYRTPPRPITLVPPPTLLRLSSVSYEPAYLHHPAPAGEGYEALRGLRQRMPEERLSLTGDKTILVVPAGTELVLQAQTEEPIVAAWAVPRVGRIPGAAAGAATPVPLTITDAVVADDGRPMGRTFSIAFRGEFRLRSPVEFSLLMENADGIQAQRDILIQIVEDQPPVLEVAPDIIRRVGNLYYVTPRAKIPFNPNSYVRDDNGLSKVEYVATSYAEDTEVGRLLRAASALQLVGPVPLSGSAAAIELARAAVQTRWATPEVQRQQSSFLLAKFYRLEQALRRETLSHLRSILDQPLPRERRELVRNFTLQTQLLPVRTLRPDGSLESFRWEIDGDYFDVRGLNLEAPPGDVQPRYRVDLAVRVTDTNFDSGPQATQTPEPIRLLIVSPGDLLVEIGKEEEALASRLDEALRRLSDAQRKYAYVRSVHESQRGEELDPCRVRAKDAAQDLAKAREVVLQVSREFRRIERECIVNQLDERIIAHYGLFANRLDRILGDNPFPVSPQEDDELRRGVLVPEQTFPVVDQLQQQVQTHLEEGRLAPLPEVVAAENAFNALYRELSKIRSILGEALSKDRLIRELAALIERRERIRAELLKWRAEFEADQFAKDPAIGPIGAVFLAKGETRRLQHTIRWRQYEEDELIVRLSSSNPAAVQVPPTLKLNFEQNQNDFSYEVRAGTIEGEFEITLSPQVGKPVTVKVTVK